MALDAATMANYLKSACSGATDNTILGTEIANYLIANLEIQFSWSAVGPPPASLPDPVTTASGEMISCIITFTGGQTDHTQSQTMMGSAINVGVTAATFNITDPEFTTTPGVYGSPGTLTITTISYNFLGSFSSPPASTTEGDYYFNTSDNISYVYFDGGWLDFSNAAFLNLCKQIIDWMLAYTPTAVISGTRTTTPYTGSGTPTSVS